MGGVGDTGMCQRFCIGGEKSRLTPPNFHYTPKAFTVRTLHRGPPSPLERTPHPDHRSTTVTVARPYCMVMGALHFAF